MAVQGENGSVVAVSSLDSRVRPKRFYLQPGAEGYRVEAIYEHDAWRNDHQVPVPRWRLVRAPTLDDALAPHFIYLQQAFQLVPWNERADLPAWARDIALVVTLHGMPDAWKQSAFCGTGWLGSLPWHPMSDVAISISAEGRMVAVPEV